jgi:hypothetical protein
MATIFQDKGITVDVFAVPPLGCNCSIIGDPETKKGVVVDPGKYSVYSSKYLLLTVLQAATATRLSPSCRRAASRWTRSWSRTGTWTT